SRKAIEPFSCRPVSPTSDSACSSPPRILALPALTRVGDAPCCTLSWMASKSVSNTSASTIRCRLNQEDLSPSSHDLEVSGPNSASLGEGSGPETRVVQPPAMKPLLQLTYAMTSSLKCHWTPTVGSKMCHCWPSEVPGK